jgi:hypothetical protein
MDGMFGGAPKGIAAMLAAKGKVSEKEDDAEEAGSSDVEMAMEDFLAAADAKDAKGMAVAFEAAFRALELAPHEEADREE